jgi:hypothetical protein
MGRRVRAGRPIVKRTRVLPPPPGMEATRGQSQEPRSARNGPQARARSTARGIRILSRPSGRRSCAMVNPELRSRVRASRRSAVSFFTRRRSAKISCWSSEALRFVTSRLTTTLGAWHGPSSEEPRDPWRTVLAAAALSCNAAGSTSEAPLSIGVLPAHQDTHSQIKSPLAGELLGDLLPHAESASGNRRWSSSSI